MTERISVRPGFGLVVALFISTLPAIQATAASKASAAVPNPYAARDLTFTARKMAMVWLNGRTEATVYREYHAPPDKWRVEYLAPQSASGRIMIQVGDTIWQWEPGEGTLFVTSGAVETHNLDSIQPLLLSNYRIEVLSEKKTVAGRSCRQLKLIPKHPGKPSRLVWVDRATGVILRRERYSSKGALQLISHCTEFKPGSVSASLFDPKRLPKGKTVKRSWPRKELSPTELRKLMGISPPAGLKGGFKLDSRSMVSERPAVVQLTYSDGFTAISLFSSSGENRSAPVGGRKVRLGKTEATATMFGHLTSVNWRSGRFDYTLVGDISEKALLEIARLLIS